MINKITKLVFLLFASVAMAQTGHIMQGVGAVNMSMGGAATGQPLDISGAMQWNPAALSTFDGSILRFDIGAFSSSPELFSTVPTPNGPFSGSTEDDRGISPMPALSFAWGDKDSKHTFGVSAFGVSYFGVASLGGVSTFTSAAAGSGYSGAASSSFGGVSALASCYYS